MNTVERFQPVIILLAAIIGLAAGSISAVQEHAGFFVVPFLMIMLYGLFLMIPVKNVVASIKNVRFISASLIINFVWTPLIAYGLGMLFLSDHPLLWVGFIMLTVTPCTDWYLVFTGISKGNTSLSTSVLPINLILQVVLLPLYLYIFFGTSQTLSISWGTVLQSIVLVVILPMVLAVITRQLLKQDMLNNTVVPFFERYNVLILSLAVLAMFASERDVLMDNLHVVSLLIAPLLLFFLITMAVGLSTGKMMKFNYADTVSLVMMTLARNSPLALAIAVTAFPEAPIIALALVIGPLIELPVLAAASQFLLKIRGNRH